MIDTLVTAVIVFLAVLIVPLFVRKSQTWKKAMISAVVATALITLWQLFKSL